MCFIRDFFSIDLNALQMFIKLITVLARKRKNAGEVYVVDCDCETCFTWVGWRCTFLIISCFLDKNT
jgi:hypothetical protein